MTASAYFSYRASNGGDVRWFWYTFILGFAPTWAIVARYSKDLVSDAVLYDILVSVVYFIAMIVFTRQWATLQWWKYMGFAMAVTGTIVMRIG